MVNFTNIKFDSEYIYADAYDHDYKVSGKIRVHRIKEEFYTDCQSNNQFTKAVWTMRRDVNKGKIKQNGKSCIAWG